MELKGIGSKKESDWIIGKCMTCNEYNFMESFSNAKKTSFSNFYPKENLSKEEFSEEQAKTRLEQVKYWRK
jgi:predicted ATP-dependent serine protease